MNGNHRSIGSCLGGCMEPGGGSGRGGRRPHLAWPGIAAAAGTTARILHSGREPGRSLDHRSARCPRTDFVRAGIAPAESGAGGAPAAADAHAGRSASRANGHLCGIAAELEANGFEVEPFGPRTIAIKGAPAGLEGSALERMLVEVLEQAEPRNRQKIWRRRVPGSPLPSPATRPSR